ncbi:hypothetical protein RRF57_008860 [Xylaria bambusicola]|uniref:Uncharacterized protein n=1 Tax=Xylaria bambusicola TaxID=326684 RepID=A0AAN7UW06_9PEZI
MGIVRIFGTGVTIRAEKNVSDSNLAKSEVATSLNTLKAGYASNPFASFPNPLTKYQFSSKGYEAWGITQSSFTPATPVAAPVTSLTVNVAPPQIKEENVSQTTPAIASVTTIWPNPAIHVIAPVPPAAPLPTQSAHSQEFTPIQRRNRERLEALATRVHNFNGSVTELLTVVNVQEELDIAFGNLDYARNELKDVLRQFEVNGYISNRQNRKRYGALKDMTQATRRHGQLMNQLWNLQRR